MTADDIADRRDGPERELTDDADHVAHPGSPRSDERRRLERRVAELEATVDELEAAVQAVRGYAGNVRAVNRDVERRASAALAKVEALESSLHADTVTSPGRTQASGNGPPAGPNEGLNSEPTLIAESGDDGVGDPPGGRESGQRADDSGPSPGEADASTGHSGDAGQQVDPGDDEGEGDGTEQFIQRVRDAI